MKGFNLNDYRNFIWHEYKLYYVKNAVYSFRSRINGEVICACPTEKQAINYILNHFNTFIDLFSNFVDAYCDTLENEEHIEYFKNLDLSIELLESSILPIHLKSEFLTALESFLDSYNSFYLHTA